MNSNPFPPRIALFGGSFDPVHLGHLLVAEAAREELGLSRLYFVPAARSPFKPELETTPADLRLRLLRLALAGKSWCEIDEQEISRGGVSYTIDTLRDYARRFPQVTLFCLIGEDHFPALPRWREAEALAQLAEFVVIPRPTGCGEGGRGAGEEMNIQHPASDIQPRTSSSQQSAYPSLHHSITHPSANIEQPTTKIEHPPSAPHHPSSIVHHPTPQNPPTHHPAISPSVNPRLSGLAAEDVGRLFRVRRLAGFPLGVSSSQIRARVKAGLSIEHLTLPAVAEAIRDNRLYL